ncbi:MAG TPA: CpsD/CapB family tyrosine-protein kinase [Terriglobia bacterium]|nr:CpsD/CapB family tyrosine-protein kinase [Terriglobia bacterium]
MSTNFEIVRRQANQDLELFHVAERAVVPSRANGRGIDLHKLTHEETIKLVRRVFFSGATTPQVVVFSGIEHGSGCSWVCARTAQVLAAHVESPVCLVEANLRFPSLHRYFETVVPGDASNLWLLSHGAKQADRQATAGLDRLQSQVSDLRANFAHILIDAPPINAYADAVLLAGIADGLVMIVEANNTPREAAMRAKEVVDAAGIRLLGAVLNKRTFPIPERLYRKL